MITQSIRKAALMLTGILGLTIASAGLAHAADGGPRLVQMAQGRYDGYDYGYSRYDDGYGRRHHWGHRRDFGYDGYRERRVYREGYDYAPRPAYVRTVVVHERPVYVRRTVYRHRPVRHVRTIVYRRPAHRRAVVYTKTTVYTKRTYVRPVARRVVYRY
jgi:hypothetical protein